MDYLLKGVPASRGVARGRVRLVHEWSRDVVLRRGEVLVVHFPAPSLSPLLSQAEALVCAFGGSLSALITLAQEYHIPAVIGLGDAVGQLREGDQVWVDGVTGIVSTFDSRGVWQVNVNGLVRLPKLKADALLSVTA